MNRNHRNIYLVITLLLALTLSFSLFSFASEETYSKKISAIKAFVEKRMKVDRIPGLIIALYKDDFTWAQGFGYSDLENKVEAKPETAVRLASVSKLMASIAALKLAQEGKLDLDGDIRKYVPYWPEKRWVVTSRLLMGHLGGISHYKNYDLEGHFKTHYDTRASIDVFKDWDLIAEPGTRYQYSSYGYNLLGAVVEGASGEKFGPHMRANVWDPFGMDNTRLDSPDDLIPNRSRGYRIINGEIKNSEFVDISSRFAAGGLRSTMLDLMKLSRGLDEGKVLEPKYMDMMYTSLTKKDGRDTGYALGWRTGSRSGRWVVSHSGSQAETRTFFLRIPREKFAVAVASNLEGSSPRLYVNAIMAIFMNDYPLDVEITSPEKAAVLVGISLAWNNGLGYRQRYDKPFTENSEELAKAFEHFNQNVKEGSAVSTLRDGIHPLTGRPLIAVGSYMAQQLLNKHGKEKLDNYRNMNPFEFFADYIALYKADSGISSQYRFTAEMENALPALKTRWDAVWTDEVKSAYLMNDSELEKIIPTLVKIFSDKPFYPDFSMRLNSYAYLLKGRGELDRGLEILKTAAVLYPSDFNLLDSIAEFYLEKGDKKISREYYLKALDKDPRMFSAKQALLKFEPYALTSDQKEAIIGEYQFADGMKATIKMENGVLIVYPTGLPRMRVHAITDTMCLVEEEDGDVTTIEFDKDEKGNITAITVFVSGADMKGTKVQ